MIPPDGDRWTPPVFDLLDLQAILSLPEIGGRACRPGVYFLFLDGALQYVGSSGNVRYRVLRHEADQVFTFDHARYLPVAWPWHLAVEGLYIQQYKPPQNTAFAL